MEAWEKQIYREFVQEMLEQIINGKLKGKQVVIIDTKPIDDCLDKLQEKIGNGLNYDFIYRIIFEAIRSKKDYESLRRDFETNVSDIYLSLLDDWYDFYYEGNLEEVLYDALLRLCREMRKRLDGFNLYKKGELICKYEGVIPHHRAILTIL